MRPFVIPIIFAAGALTSRMLTDATPARFAVDLRQPLPVATAWGGFGTACWIALVLALLAATIPYARILSSGRIPRVRTTMIVVTAVYAVGYLWTPLFSSDVYAYAAYGEMARMGIDPYAHAAVPASNPLFAAAIWQWSNPLPVCVYGVVFVWLMRAVVTVTALFPVAIRLDAVRLLMQIAGIALGPAAASLAPADRKRRVAFFVAANPLVLWAGIEGHNDVLAVSLTLWGLAAAARRPFTAAIVLAAAALSKIPAIVPAAIALFQRTRNAAYQSSASILVLFAGIALGTWPVARAFTVHIARHGTYAPFASVQSLGMPFAIATAILVLSRLPVIRGRFNRVGVLLLALWASVPNPQPWYALWIVAPAAYCTDPRVQKALLSVAAASLLRYLPDCSGIPDACAATALALVATLAYVPLWFELQKRREPKPAAFL